VLHQLVDSDIRIFLECGESVHHLHQIVRRDVGCHPAVPWAVDESGFGSRLRQNRRLLLLAIVVGLKITFLAVSASIRQATETTLRASMAAALSPSIERSFPAVDEGITGVNGCAIHPGCRRWRVTVVKRPSSPTMRAHLT
jgi:hypothetical protein